MAGAGSMSRSKRSSPTIPDAAVAPADLGALVQAVQATPTGVVLSDPNQPDCPIVYANPAFFRITGFPPAEVIGRNCRFLQGRGSEPAAIHAIRRAIAEARPVDVRLTNYRRDGSRFVNELHISPVFDASGRLTHFLGIQHDVTARVRAERATAQAQRRAERANQAKTDFLAFMSHEVRTPLNGIMGTLSLLADTPLDAEQQAYLETARRCADTLLWTVNEVLDLSRIEAGMLTLEDVAFPLADPVGEVLALVRPAAQRKGLALTARIDPGLPAIIRGDPARLRQVLLNLADNACKFTATGGIAIEISRSPDATRGDRLVVSVSDTGEGIPDKLRRRLFRRFQQADAGTARRHGGSGLGLMICRQLVALMEGGIGVDSKPGAGSVFRFDLPLRPAALAAAAKPAPPAWAEPPRPLPGAPPRARLLLAEDSEASQLVAAAILRRAGYEVDLARDGAEALELAGPGHYDGILMDVRMPRMDGYQATAAIRALPGPAGRVPILALTAFALPGDAERSLAAGMDGHLVKPVDRPRLLAAVGALLNGVPQRPRQPGPLPEPGPGMALVGRDTLDELRAAVGPGRLPDLVGVFAVETIGRLKRLQADQRPALVSAEAHGLHAAAGTFGAAALRDAALALERAAVDGDASAIAALIAALPALVERTLHALTRAMAMTGEVAD
jgi:PAS domain S-box-containing protein